MANAFQLTTSAALSLKLRVAVASRRLLLSVEPFLMVTLMMNWLSLGLPASSVTNCAVFHEVKHLLSGFLLQIKSVQMHMHAHFY